MNRRIAIIIVIVLAAMLLLAVTAAGIVIACSGWGGGGNIGLIRVEGVIASGRGNPSLFSEGYAGSERIVQQLKRFRKDDSTKVLVLRINSPGGSPAASQEIYQEILKVREAGKRVIVSMGDVAASGGYYIACAGDSIYASPGTITGSIGVIIQTPDLHELMDKYGVDINTVKSGAHKDIGSFSRPMTEADRAILQSMIDDTYDQFVTDVSTSRKLPKNDVLKLADGRVFTGRQAASLKLVDRTGTLEDAFDAAARASRIRGDYKVVEYERSSGLVDILLGSGAKTGLPDWLHRNNSLVEMARGLLRADLNLE